MKRGRTLSHILVDYSGPSFSDLPMDIMVNVLSRLSVKRIFVCKLVSKTWHDIISNPEFAKLHFDQARAYPLIQISRYNIPSTMLYLVRPEEEDFELKLGTCDHSERKSKCYCRVKFELDTKFKLPLRNPQMPESNDFIRSKMEANQYRVVNSCNGLLCLSIPYNHETLVVCNPVSGEFIDLPKAKMNSCCWDTMLCGLGFDPARNEYKVIRIIQRQNLSSIGAEVHTLSTKTWKDIEISSKVINGLRPAYLNGFLYWACLARSLLCLISFDVGKECFRSISAPPIQFSMLWRVNLGVLGGELSISCSFRSGVNEIWVRKNNGTAKLWTKVFSIQLEGRISTCQPVKYLNDGALLMFDSSSNSLIYKHPTKVGLRYFNFRGTTAPMEATTHIPSFVSLKDALSGHSVEVLDVKSRCGNLKMLNEDKRIYVVEKHTKRFW